MRVLLDGNLPRTLAALLPGHRVETIHQRRWSDLDDGPLLVAAEGEYDVFLTADQNLRYQQNLSGRRLRIIVLRAPRNSLPALAPLAPRILHVLAAMRPGELRVVSS